MQSKFFHHPQFLYNDIFYYWFFGILGFFSVIIREHGFGKWKVYCVSNITFHAEFKYAIKSFSSPTVFVQWNFLLLIFRNFRNFFQWYYYTWTNILNSFQQRVVTYNLPLSNRYVLRNRKWMKQTLSHGAGHYAESYRMTLHKYASTTHSLCMHPVKLHFVLSTV